MQRIILILTFILMPAWVFAQTAGKDYMEYVVQPKETIFSISRATGIKVSDILDINPGFTRLTKLKIGQIVKLPKGTTVVDPTYVPSPENIVTTPIDPTKGVMIPATFVGDNSGKCVIALMLPFYAAESGFSEDEGVSRSRKVPARAEQFMQFYEGTLMALDSLKRSGINVDYQVFDVGRGIDMLAKEMAAINELSPDIIIGPIYEDQTKYLCDNLQNKNTPVIYPLSAKISALSAYNNVVVVNISDKSLSEEMIVWLNGVKMRDNGNVIYMDMNNSVKGVSEQVKQRLNQVSELVTYKWNSNITADSNATLLKPFMKSDVENYFVVATENQAELSRILPILLLCNDEYKITLLGMPDWQTFTLLEVENYFKLNTTLFTYSYTDPANQEMSRFSKEFVKYFGYVPTNLACKGYDVALFAAQIARSIDKGEFSTLSGYKSEGPFSTYRLVPINGGAVLENRSLYSVTYGRDYKLHINKAN